jgi:phosphoglycolate phosphatase-like HAD superfamily hydrolase
VGPPDKIIREVWPGSDVENIVKEWGEDREPISLVPGGFETLMKLFCDFYLSILTSRGWESTHFHIHNYRHLFRFVITSQDTEFHKPDPRSMHPIIKNYKLLGVPQENIVYVGDNVDADWKLAHSLEMKFYAVTTGINSRKDFLAAGLSSDHVLNSITDLPNILIP